MSALRFLLLLLATVLLQSCQYDDVAIADIRNFKIDKMEENRIYISFDAKIINPNSYSLKVSATDLMFEINGVNMGFLHLSEAVKIPAGNDDYIPVRSSVSTKDAAQNVLSIVLGSVFSRAVDIRLKGDIKGGILFFPRKIPIDHSERIEWNGSMKR